ncbi:FxsA family protein [Virgibacillus kimchii]
MRWVLLTLMVLSAFEIGVFIWIGGMIGPWWVVFLIIMTGVIGVYLSKQQGIDTWKKAQLSMQQGEAPTSYIIDGICILIGAALLFTPGFISDITGLLLVIPGTRNMFKHSLEKFIRRMMDKHTIIYRKW